MQLISQNPTDEDFIQDPYKFYKNFVSTDGLYFWNEYNMAAVFDAAGQELLFKDKRFGREKLKNQSSEDDRHLKPAEIPPSCEVDVLIVESTYGVEKHENR